MAAGTPRTWRAGRSGKPPQPTRTSQKTAPLTRGTIADIRISWKPFNPGPEGPGRGLARRALLRMDVEAGWRPPREQKPPGAAAQRSAGKYALISQPQAISTSFGVCHCIRATSAGLTHAAVAGTAPAHTGEPYWQLRSIR